MSRLKFYRQRPVKGGREPLPACVLKSIYQEVDRQARKHHVSRSFVIATVLAKAFCVGDQEDYTTAAEARQNPPPVPGLPKPAPPEPPLRAHDHHQNQGANAGRPELPPPAKKQRRWAMPALT
jgi:hypothetical protein